MTIAVTIGTRVHSNLYGRGYGTVFAIHGEQSPETVRSIAGVINAGGRATFDIVFDQGCLSRQLPECILRGVQWDILSEVVDARHIADALARASAEEQKARQKAADAKAAFDIEVEQLRSDKDFAALTQGTDTGSGKLAAKNIRLQLRSAFPGVRFSVRVRDYGSIDIEWTDGPTAKQVTAITNQYQAGRFDGMEDIYRSSESPWNKVFGGAKYVFTQRGTSDELVEKAIAAVFAAYVGNFSGSDIVATATDYRAGRLFNVKIPLLGDSLETAIRMAASEIDGRSERPTR